MTVAEARTTDLDALREMLHEYAAWLAIDLSFQDFAREVAELPGDYAAPHGALLMARVADEPVGMVAYRRLDRDRAEMKRLYVRPTARGTGVGRLLIEHIITAARRSGYQTMVLDTLPVMHSAQRMYEQFGFRDTPPYYDSPIRGTRYMALTL